MSRHETRNARNLRASKERLIKSGGRRLTVNLSPRACKAIRAIRDNDPFIGSDREAIEHALRTMVSVIVGDSVIPTRS
jgi:hypothetical protein